MEFRTTLEPVRARNAGVEYIQGWADDVNFDRKTLTIETIASQSGGLDGSRVNASRSSISDALNLTATNKKGELFDITYDKLVVAVGCYSQTFGTKGVRENALFLKDVGDARRIRRRILECSSTHFLSD